MLKTSLAKHNRRLEERDSLPVNVATEAGGSKVSSQAPVRGLGDQKLKLSAHLHMIFSIFALSKIWILQTFETVNLGRGFLEAMASLASLCIRHCLPLSSSLPLEVGPVKFS